MSSIQITTLSKTECDEENEIQWWVLCKHYINVRVWDLQGPWNCNGHARMSSRGACVYWGDTSPLTRPRLLSYWCAVSPEIEKIHRWAENCWNLHEFERRCTRKISSQTRNSAGEKLEQVKSLQDIHHNSLGWRNLLELQNKETMASTNSTPLAHQPARQAASLEAWPAVTGSPPGSPAASQTVCQIVRQARLTQVAAPLSGQAHTRSCTVRTCAPLVQHTRLVRRDHVLDVDEGVLAAVPLEHLQRFVDEITDVFPLLLAVVDAVAEITCSATPTQVCQRTIFRLGVKRLVRMSQV